jgi:hypothetical protein
LLLVISFTFQNIVIAQNTNQQQSNNSTEHFSLVLALEGEAKVNYTFQQGNLLAIVYGKSNLKVIDLDSNNIVYGISNPNAFFHHPYILDNYLLYTVSGQTDTVRVNLSTRESINLPGRFNQVTDDGYLITYYKIFRLINVDEREVVFEQDIRRGHPVVLTIGNMFILSPINDKGYYDSYQFFSNSDETFGELKFTLEENSEEEFYLPDYRSKISKFPLPILKVERDSLGGEHWFLEFIDEEGHVIAQHSFADELGINFESIPGNPLIVIDENQNGFLLEIISWKKTGNDYNYHYILSDLSGGVLKIFNEERPLYHAALDSQGNVLFLNRNNNSKTLSYYYQDGTPFFSKQVSPSPKKFRFLSQNEILLKQNYGFEKYLLPTGEITGIYPISPKNYFIYSNPIFIYDNKVYFFAETRGGFEPNILGTNLFSFSVADSGWLDIELVSINPNAGTKYQVFNNENVTVKFRTQHDINLWNDILVDFKKGTASAVNNNNLEYIWHTPIILNGNEDTSKITVSCGQTTEQFVINIRNPHPPTAAFEFYRSSPETGEPIHFDGHNSVDIGGRILSYHWDFGDGITTECLQSSTEHIFSQAGEYPVTLTVTDNQGGTAQISQNIEVVEAIEASLQVTVLDGEITLERVEVTLLKNTETGFIDQDRLITETDGTCEFLDLEVGDYRVLLEDLDQEEGYIPPGITEVTLAEGANSIEINVEPSKGFGVAFFKNAPPGPLGRAVPEAHPSPWNSEWRPIWVSDKFTFNMPKSPYFYLQDFDKQTNYTSSARSWKDNLPSTTLFSNSRYIRGKSPSTVWRRYDLTLFEEVNGTPIVVPADISNDPYYQHQNPYAFTGTLSAKELPSNWYLDPWKRWLVENAMSGGLPDTGNWRLFDQTATIFKGNATVASVVLGPVGVLIYVGLLAIEYWTIFEYEQLVISMEEDYQKYLQSSLKNTPTPNDYFSIYNASLDKPTIVRRDVPNYQKTWNVKSQSWESYISPDYTNASNTSSSERDNPIGGFTIQARTTEINAPQLQPGTASRVVAINKAFTSASIPFQFVLRVNTDGGDDATAQVKGHFFVRLHLPSIAGDSSRPERWVELDVAGIKNDQWLSPWELIRTTIDTQTYMRCTTTNQGGIENIPTFLSENGAQDLLLAWAGDVTLRANDFGVDRFEEMEFGIKIATDNYNSSIFESAKADATLSVQPIFSHNIAEAGPWKAVPANTSVRFVPNANFLPSNVQSVTYKWYLENEDEEILLHTMTVEGLEGTEEEWVKRRDAFTDHTFSQPGVYTVWLKVDPDVPEGAANADLFNVDTGVSYDICKVWVYQSP